MQKRTKIIVVVLIAFIFAAIIVFPYIRQWMQNDTGVPAQSGTLSAREKAPLVVNAQVVNYEALADNFITIGSILPDEEVNLSFETSGKITKIQFQEGSNVTRGQLLAKVNDEPLQAELKKLRAQMQLAEDRVTRQRTLLEKDAVSKEAFEQVVTDLEKLKADVELIAARIAQTELRAPFDGIIGLRSVSEGQYVTPATHIAMLTKIVPLKVEFSINERQANEIQAGTSLKFSLQENTDSYNAEVYAVGSMLNTKTRTLTARALYPNYNGRLKPGRSCSIEINLKEIRNAITAPSEAIVADMGNAIAFVYKSGKAEAIKVTKGLRTASKIQILDGLSIGDTLITSGTMQLRAGMPVELNMIDNLIE